MEFPLTEQDREELKTIHKSLKDKRKADKIKTILMLDLGYTATEISLSLMIDQNTITRWKKKFLKSKNLEVWLSYNYVPYGGRLNEKELELVKSFIDNNIINDSKQIICFIKEQFGKEYSTSGVLSLLKKLNYSYKQLIKFNKKSDPEVQNQFLQGIEAINETLEEGKEVILFMDGVHPQHNTHTSKAWIMVGKQKFIECNSGRERMNLNGAYNPNNQDVFIREDEAVNADSTIKLFQTIENRYSEKEVIYIFSDNANYYRSKKVKEYLKNSRIILIFIPAYSPNLNLIERLWKFMRKKVINTNYYATFADFRKSILDFFDNIGIYKSELKKFIGFNFHIIYPEYLQTTSR